MSEGLHKYMFPYGGREYYIVAADYRSVRKQMAEKLGVTIKSLNSITPQRLTKTVRAKTFTQLCFSCARSAAPPHIQCCWDRTLKPVPGWTAEVVCRPYMAVGGVDNNGYKIYECPEYLEMEKKA